MIVRRLCLLAFITLSACSITATTEPLQPPTATTLRVVSSTLVPTVSRLLNEIPQSEGTATPLRPVDCQQTAGQAATQYRVIANLNYGQRAMLVQQVIRYINRSNDVLEQLVLTVEPTQWPGAFALNEVTLAGSAAGYELTGRRLEIELPLPLEPGCATEIDLGFRLNIPQIGDGVSAYRGFLGYSPRQLNLGHWLPVIAPHVDGEWLLHEAVFVGEQAVLDVADWDVTLNVSGAPENLIVAGPGASTRSGERTWHFVVRGSRDFALSLSDEYLETSAATESGVIVKLYSFDDAQVTLDDGKQVDGAAHALDTAVRSLEMFEDLYGPYPHERLVVIEGDFPDGMEFSGLVFVSRDWFTRFTGNPASFLTVITAHEVAHQWWYAAVGSDQALSPWLDEALSTYSEYVFIEEYYADLKDWWWAWRVENYSPEGSVDSNVYHFSTIRDYINAVYLRGARMLHEIRQAMGTEAFFAFLRRYLEAGTGRIVDADVFWSLMSAEELADTRAIRLRYLRQAGPDQ